MIRPLQGRHAKGLSWASLILGFVLVWSNKEGVDSFALIASVACGGAFGATAAGRFSYRAPRDDEPYPEGEDD